MKEITNKLPREPYGPIYGQYPHEQTIFENRCPMYQHGPPIQLQALQVNDSYVGETIEQRVEKILNNKEPITDGAPTIYTERSEGVIPEYDIRTDKWDAALDLTEQIHDNAMNHRKKLAEEKIKANLAETQTTTRITPTGNATTQTEPAK